MAIAGAEAGESVTELARRVERAFQAPLITDAGQHRIKISIGAAVLGLAICIAIFGEPFLANLLTPRPYRLMRAVSGLGRLQWILPALAIWAIWAWRDRAMPQSEEKWIRQPL